MTVTDVYYDPYDYAIDADPYPVWQRLRDEAPVYYNEKHDFWTLSRYDDVLRGLLDTRDVRVEPRDRARDDHATSPTRHPDDDHDGPARAHAAAQARGPGVHAAAHRRPRGEDRARSANEFLDTVDGEDEFDYVEHFAGLLPPTVILVAGRLPRGPRQGVPASSPTRACTSTKATTTTHGQQIPPDRQRERRDQQRGVRHDPRAHGERRKDPQDDLLTGLVHAEIEERRRRPARSRSRRSSRSCS